MESLLSSVKVLESSFINLLSNPDDQGWTLNSICKLLGFMGAPGDKCVVLVARPDWVELTCQQRGQICAEFDGALRRVCHFISGRPRYRYVAIISLRDGCGISFENQIKKAVDALKTSASKQAPLLGGCLNIASGEVIASSRYAQTSYRTAIARLSLHFEPTNKRENAVDANHSPDPVALAMEFAAQNFNRDITLLDVSEHVHLSQYHFSRLFKQANGQGFAAYLSNMRLEKAKALFLETSLSVKQIALESGCVDPNYFSRAFKQAYGVSPSAFRENSSRLQNGN